MALLRRKFVALNAYVRKKEDSQVNNTSSHLKNLENIKQNKCKANRRKEIIKMRTKINEIKNKNDF